MKRHSEIIADLAIGAGLGIAMFFLAILTLRMIPPAMEAFPRVAEWLLR